MVWSPRDGYGPRALLPSFIMGQPRNEQGSPIIKTRFLQPVEGPMDENRHVLSGNVFKKKEHIFYPFLPPPG